MPSARELNAARSDARRAIDELLARGFVAFALALSCAGIAFTALIAPHKPLSQVGWIAAVSLGFAAAMLVASRLARTGRTQMGVQLMLLAIWAVVTGYAVATGLGVHSVSLGLFIVLIVSAGVLVGPGTTWTYAATCAATVVALYLAEARGLLPGSAAATTMPAYVRLFAHAVSIAAGTLLALLLGRAFVAALAAARHKERRFRSLLGIAAEWYWEQDAELRFTRIAAAGHDSTEPRLARRLGKTLWELDGYAPVGADWSAHQAAVRAHQPFRNLLAFHTARDGRLQYVSVSGEPVFDEAGRFTGYWGTARDVSTEFSAQRAVQASDARYRDLFAIAPSPFIIHRAGRVLQANAAAARLFGYADAAALLGQAMVDLNHADSRAFAAQRIAAMEAMPVGGSVPAAEIRMQRRDGGELFVQATVVRIEQPDGAASLSIYFDLTERRRDEARLAQSEAMLSRLFLTSPDYITVSELASGRFVLVNEGFTALSGYQRDEVIGRTSHDIGIWFDPQQRAQLVDGVQRDGIVRNLPVTFRVRDGRLSRVLITGASFEMNGGAYLVASARDVTQSEEQRLQYEAMFRNASAGIAITREARFQHVNPRMAELVGWTAAELTGQPGSVVWPSVEDYHEVGRRFGPALGRGEGVDFEWQLRRRDGALLWARMLARAIDPRSPAAGGTIWIIEDITERRAAQQALAAARDEAEAANRTKSAFLANISHEIRTPLNGLLGLSRLALEPNVDGTQQKKYLRTIFDSAQTLAGIISDLLDISKIEAGKLDIVRVDFNLRELLESIHAAYAELAAAKGLTSELHLQDDTPAYVYADPVRVRQIVSNLLSNALKFTTHGRIDLGVGAAGAGRLRIGVTDTGIGIDAATLQRLFTPFTQADESTTRRFGGTGLGLSICKQLAGLMGGEVGVESEPGAGSMFWVELPMPAVPGAAAPARAAAADLATLDGVRVLLVEDNAVNMLIAETLLASWGVQVIKATDGREAIEAAAREDGRLDAILMDVHMPVMGGHEATTLLRKRYPKETLPIIALTAAALVSEQEQSLALGMNDFVSKPIDADRLRQVVTCWTVGRRSAALTR